MTYSIGMRAPSHAELLVDFAETLAEALPETQRFADPDLAPTRGDGEIDAAAIARVRRALPWAGDAETAALRLWFGRFITRYRSAQVVAPPGRALGDAAFAAALANDAPLRRNPWSRLAWMRSGRNATLFASGANYRCSVPFARLVCAQMAFVPSAVPGNADDRRTLRALIDAGHLAFVRPRRRRNPA